MSAFPTGQPREDQLEMVVCKHCKRPTLKPTAAEHIRGCLRAKQEKARRKKEARDANRAKERIEKGVVDGEDETGGVGGGDGADDNTAKGQKSAKKSAKGTGDDGTKKGKKRKMDGEDEKDGNNASKEPGKKKKKKDEPKAKAPRPKGPVDVEKQCGVTLPNGAQCARSLTCKSHSMGAKRAVPGRSLPYDMLLQAYQKKNQARQQSGFSLYGVCMLSFLPPGADLILLFYFICRGGHRRQCATSRRHGQRRSCRLGRRAGCRHGIYCPVTSPAARHAASDLDEEEISLCADQRNAISCARRHGRWWPLLDQRVDIPNEHESIRTRRRY